MKKDECVFCEIVRGKAKVYRIAESELSIAILDINPLSQGHCLVIPKRHVAWWHDMSDKESQSLFSIAQEVARRIMDAFGPDFVAMYVRGRRIPHTHVFLVPSYRNDPLDRFFNALEGFQESPKHLMELRGQASMKATARKLRSARPASHAQ